MLSLSSRFFFPIRRKLPLFWVCNELPCIAQACASHGSWPAPLVCPPSLPVRREGGLHLQHKRGACSLLPCANYKEGHTGSGRWGTLQMLVLLQLFFLWVRCCPNQCLVCWVLFGNLEPIGDAIGQGMWGPCAGNPHWELVNGSSCSTGRLLTLSALSSLKNFAWLAPFIFKYHVLPEVFHSRPT